MVIICFWGCPTPVDWSRKLPVGGDHISISVLALVVVVPEGSYVHPRDLWRLQDLSKIPHQGTIHLQAGVRSQGFKQDLTCKKILNQQLFFNDFPSMLGFCKQEWYKLVMLPAKIRQQVAIRSFLTTGFSTTAFFFSNHLQHIQQETSQTWGNPNFGQYESIISHGFVWK